MEVIATRLRYVCSKDADIIMVYTNGLPYKIEIKGGLSVKKGKFYLSFVVPDNVGLKNGIKEKISGDLDI